MITIYVYVLNTLADWELGHLTSELNSRRYFKKNAKEVEVKTVSVSKAPVRTMGGLSIVPDCTVEEMTVDETNVLVLPGADTWMDGQNGAVLEKAREFLAVGGTVCAICGATVALASVGLLDTCCHTSNGPGFLDMFCPDYKGQDFYIDAPAVEENGLITAGCTAGLLWAKLLIGKLGVFEADTLEAWYEYFSTGAMDKFFALMQTLPSGK